MNPEQETPDVNEDDVFSVQSKVELIRKNFGEQGEASAAGAAMLRTQTKYGGSMSVLKPRSLAAVRDACLAEAEIAGEEFFYRWEVMDKKTGEISEVKGLSVQGAMCVARLFGNCDVDSVLEQETPEAWFYRGAFVDKETNFTVSRLFRMSRTAVMFGNMDPERKDIARFNKGCSMAMRNAVEDAVPSWLVKEVVETAQRAAIADVTKALHVQFKGSLEKFTIWLFRRKLEPFGVSVQALLHKFGRTSAKGFSVYDIVKMKLDSLALANETSTAEQLYPEPEKGKAQPTAAGQGQGQQQAGSQDQQASLADEVSDEDVAGFGKAPADAGKAAGGDRASQIVDQLKSGPAAGVDAAVPGQEGEQPPFRPTSQESTPGATESTPGAAGGGADPNPPEYKALLQAAKRAKSAEQLRDVSDKVDAAENEKLLPEGDVKTIRGAIARKATELGSAGG